ncbi:DUF4846 domain-containing protein [Chryseobacterium salviniae]|uniref:DUF4846 domain-containing protein n=1 Tax=Chryseobacterium salviniae TaxID=3101750 RepID=A0ABU6HRP5_9FLAO|nr:DUF4846 domain-containing protein [Chryseobacterium sp. T9W2-O]MEC3875717.1 DUF4846 domain-containing protein [Chryseobacterium sp. T9W2-O]
MKKFLTGIAFLLLIMNCSEKRSESKSLTTINEDSQNRQLIINQNKNTVRERFPAPEGYEWMEEKSGSFGYFIEHFPLKPYGSPILKYDGNKIRTQHLHEAVFELDTGNKDLQQCADAVIRLRAEYLFKSKNFDAIQFHFTSGDLVSWNDYKNGIRAFVNGNSVNFKKTAEFDDSYTNFRNYLDLIFNYAGTISLYQETSPVIKNNNLKTGDILITPGSPGHVVFISGACKNKEGKKLYLLGEGFTPAQSVHIISNPFDKNISPWYPLDVDDPEIITARYIFKPVNFRRFK